METQYEYSLLLHSVGIVYGYLMFSIIIFAN